MYFHLIEKLQSSNPLTKPEIQVNYFSVDFDLETQIAGARLSRNIFATPPLRLVSFKK